MTSSLSKIFPRLDKICDAPFIKKIIGTTKKDAIMFITENNECRRFFEEKEIEMERHNEFIKNDILQFFQRTNIAYEISKFKGIVKEKVAKEKVQKKELEKLAIIEQYLREAEKAKQEAEERIRLGLGPKPTVAATTTASAQVLAPALAPAPALAAASAVPTTISSTSGFTDNNSLANAKLSGVENQVDAGIDDNDSESLEETQMNLEDFFTMFKSVVEQGHILIGNTPLKSNQIEMNIGLQKIVINPKITPTITIKKTS